MGYRSITDQEGAYIKYPAAIGVSVGMCVVNAYDLLPYYYKEFVLIDQSEFVAALIVITPFLVEHLGFHLRVNNFSALIPYHKPYILCLAMDGVAKAARCDFECHLAGHMRLACVFM